MEKRKWLETFIELADSGAPAIEYRKRLRIKVPQLKKHVNKLGEYRKELNDILEEERVKKSREEDLRKSRETRFRAAKKREKESKKLDSDSSDNYITSFDNL